MDIFVDLDPDGHDFIVECPLRSGAGTCSAMRGTGGRSFCPDFDDTGEGPYAQKAPATCPLRLCMSVNIRGV